MNDSDLTRRFNKEIECFVFDSIHSTNDYLSQLSPSIKPQVCVSAQQTQGKGQYGRTWLSQKNRSVLLSVRYPFGLNVALNGLSLVAGLAVIEVLENYNIRGLKLKWPNDIYFNAQKLSGILVENTKVNNLQSAVIGLGLNYQLNSDFACATKWIDLSTITTTLPNLIDLQEALIKNLLQYCQIFAQDGFDVFHCKWQKYDYLFNKKLELIDKNKPIIGIAKGINAQGVLIVSTDDSLIEVHSSTQIRLI